jgi:hypothetical protein
MQKNKKIQNVFMSIACWLLLVPLHCRAVFQQEASDHQADASAGTEGGILFPLPSQN